MELTILSVLLIVVGTQYAFWTVILGIPSQLRSQYRYKLWKIRDDMMLDIYTGYLPDTDFVRENVLATEYLIKESKAMTILRFFRIRHPDRERLKMFQAYRESEYAEMDETDRKRLKDYESQMKSVFGLYLFYGSPTGWIVGMLLTAYVLARQCRKSLKSCLFSQADLKGSLKRMSDETVVSDERMAAFVGSADWNRRRFAHAPA